MKCFCQKRFCFPEVFCFSEVLSGSVFQKCFQYCFRSFLFISAFFISDFCFRSVCFSEVLFLIIFFTRSVFRTVFFLRSVFIITLFIRVFQKCFSEVIFKSVSDFSPHKCFQKSLPEVFFHTCFFSPKVFSEVLFISFVSEVVFHTWCSQAFFSSVFFRSFFFT